MATFEIGNGDSFRHNIRHQVIPAYLPNPVEKEEAEKRIANLEIGVFNYAVKEARLRKLIKKWTNPGFVCVYIDRLRSLCYNLKHTNLWSLLECEEIAIEAVANMNHQEFLPSKWQPLIQKTQLREESKFTNSSQASTDMFVCRKCKSKKCTYYEMQTRSADEPATVFVTCLDCGKHWKS